MGQGYSLTSLSAGSAGIDIPELSDLVYERSLGASRFMKSIRARHRDGIITVKVIMKPYPSMELEPYVRALVRERDVLAEMPNALGYHRIIETGNAGYLARQYMHSSLYDRLSTRPFLENIEKKWIAFQLLCALRDCHSRDVFHGDIKTENVLVTSWNWIYLTDFSSSFKPAFLPDDNPADFSFYFDTSGRRTCYLAPERFLAPGKDMDMGIRGVDWAMDIFSAGCVIAELFLEAPIFSLSQLFEYRKGGYDPEHTSLAKIEDADVRELILHMIRLDPESRYSADECLSFWRHKTFPEYFYSFLHQYMGFVTDPAPGRRQRHDPDNEHYLATEADERIERIYHDFDKISYFLGPIPKIGANEPKHPSSALTADPFPLALDLPGHGQSLGKRRIMPEDGSLIFLTLVSSSLRNTVKASTRIKACDIFMAFAERLPDEAKLDRILPFVVLLLSDHSDLVKLTAVKTVTQLLATIQVVSPVNSCLFTEYIFPRLSFFIPGPNHKPSAIVRATYASCVASLAQSSLRLLDMVQALRSDMRFQSLDYGGAEGAWKKDVSYHHLYDKARVDLTEFFEAHTKALITDDDVNVRRAFLGSVPSLCVFFGNPKANEIILSHLNTYLNDRDWMLKCAFFEVVVGVAAYVGTSSLEEFILPLMVQSLTDPEDFVVEKVFRSFTSIASLGLLQPSTTWDLLDIAVRFFMHPNLWIREAAVHFVVASTKYASRADRFSIILPVVKPFLRARIIDISEANILNNLKKPISRNVWEMSFTWASKSQKGVFWRSAARGKIFTFTRLDSPGKGNIGIRDVIASSFGSPLNDEDEQWLARLKSIGMTPEDEFKLIALREYIWRVVMRRSTNKDETDNSALLSAIPLSKHGITPQTVFFDKTQKARPSRPPPEKPHRRHVSDGKMHTIVDALLDASTTIDSDGTSRRSTARSRSHQRGENSLATDIARRESFDVASSSTSPQRNTGHPSAHTSRRNSFREDANDQENHTRGIDDNGSSRSDAIPIRKNTAIHLLNRRDTSKAGPEISTTPTNALGRVDSQTLKETYRASPLSLFAKMDSADEDHRAKYRANHSYKGTDPTVLKLLDAVYVDNLPSDVVEFGPSVSPIKPDAPMKRASGQSTASVWRPQGTLVALLGEHTGPINRVVVSPDHAFFVTASDDGSVKVWDAGRLEKNLTPRSRQTHRHAQGAQVKCLTFVTDTHTFISAATDGTIHAVRVDCHQSSDTVRYGKLQLVRDYNIADHFSRFPDEHAVWIEHFKRGTSNVLLVATSRSRIIALDLREMNPLYVLENPVNHGMVTTFCVDKKANWILVGTAHGILDLWDLRFQIRIKSWGMSGGTPIPRLQVNPLRGMGKWVCVTGGGSNGSEITVWDIDKVQCREVYRVEPPAAAVNKRPDRGMVPSPVRHTSVDMAWKKYEPWRVDDDPEGMLARFSSNFSTTADPALRDNLTGPPRSVTVERNGICALAIGLEAVQVGQETYKGGFLVSAGYDRRIRYWDVSYPDFSFIIGDEAVKGSTGKSDSSARFDVTMPVSHLRITTERSTMSDSADSNVQVKGTGKKGTTAPYIPHHLKITLQQQQLLRRHLDAILDVAILQQPYAMVVSVDRGGMIYVLQ